MLSIILDSLKKLTLIAPGVKCSSDNKVSSFLPELASPHIDIKPPRGLNFDMGDDSGTLYETAFEDMILNSAVF